MHGSGLLDTMMNAFTQSKYPNEHHYSGFSYLGPGSRLDIRLDVNLNPKPGEEPINEYILGSGSKNNEDLEKIGIYLFGSLFKGVYASDQMPLLKDNEMCIVNTDDSKR